MSPLGPVSALLAGLLGGVHCVTMCGGVAGALCAGIANDPARPQRRLALVLAYNLGRVGSYTTAGALAGGFGALASRALPVEAVAWAMRVGAAALLVLLGLHLAGVWHGVAAIERVGAPLWKRLAPLARGLLPVRTVGRALALGAVWGWLPCGLVYSMLALAMAGGSPGAGALTMAAFGVGTLPALAAVGLLAGGASRLARAPHARRAAGVLIVSFGTWSLLSALGVLPVLALPGVAGMPRHTCCQHHAATVH